jgi:ketosteroid isomerase-like protein
MRTPPPRSRRRSRATTTPGTSRTSTPSPPSTRRTSSSRNHTAGERAEGDAVRPHIAEIFRNWPDLRFSSRRLYTRDGLVVSEWTATATHPDGRRLEWDGIDVFPFENGLIKRKDVYSASHRPRVLS